MGREARCEAEWPGGAGAVRLHLDSRALELRGAIKRDLPRGDITEVAEDAGRLRLTTPDGGYAFDLGASAERWAKAIAKPPPDLAAKLGLKDSARAFAPTPIADPTLADAIAPHASAISDAAMWVATVEDEAQLTAAITAHARDAPTTSLWIANRKGKATPYGDTAIRTVMRMHGYIDTKSCAVSEHWSATRYGRR